MGLYDAFDPRTHQYVGSAVAEAAVDCVGGNPRFGCAGFHTWSDLVAGAMKGFRLEGAAHSTGVLPFEFAAQFEVRDDIGGPGSRSLPSGH